MELAEPRLPFRFRKVGKNRQENAAFAGEIREFVHRAVPRARDSTCLKFHPLHRVSRVVGGNRTCACGEAVCGHCARTCRFRAIAVLLLVLFLRHQLPGNELRRTCKDSQPANKLEFKAR